MTFSQILQTLYKTLFSGVIGDVSAPTVLNLCWQSKSRAGADIFSLRIPSAPLLEPSARPQPNGSWRGPLGIRCRWQWGDTVTRHLDHAACLCKVLGADTQIPVNSIFPDPAAPRRREGVPIPAPQRDYSGLPFAPPRRVGNEPLEAPSSSPVAHLSGLIREVTSRPRCHQRWGQWKVPILPGSAGAQAGYQSSGFRGEVVMEGTVIFKDGFVPPVPLKLSWLTMTKPTSWATASCEFAVKTPFQEGKKGEK